MHIRTPVVAAVLAALGALGVAACTPSTPAAPTTTTEATTTTTAPPVTSLTVTHAVTPAVTNPDWPVTYYAVPIRYSSPPLFPSIRIARIDGAWIAFPNAVDADPATPTPATATITGIDARLYRVIPFWAAGNPLGPAGSGAISSCVGGGGPATMPSPFGPAVGVFDATVSAGTGSGCTVTWSALPNGGGGGQPLPSR